MRLPDIGSTGPSVHGIAAVGETLAGPSKYEVVCT
jgi:hypothetical protein